MNQIHFTLCAPSSFDDNSKLITSSIRNITFLFSTGLVVDILFEASYYFYWLRQHPTAAGQLIALVRDNVRKQFIWC